MMQISKLGKGPTRARSRSTGPIRALFLLYGNASPSDRDRFHFFSKYFSGDIVKPAGRTKYSNGQQAPTDPVPVAGGVAGHFRIFEFASPNYPPLLKGPFEAASYVRIVRGLAGSGAKYDVVVAFGLFKTAIAGWVISIISGSKFIIELPIVLRKIILYRHPTRSLYTKAKAALLPVFAALLLRRADHIKLIFPGQLKENGRGLEKIATSAFPDFVAVHEISRSCQEDSLLLIGTPLYLKGADIAIKAFQCLSSRWSGVRLVIIGSSAGFPYLQTLLSARDHVEFLDFVPHEVAIDYIQGSKLVLIPSRTDAMPRVAVEAMAAGKAIIASRVDGIPHYLRHMENCLLFEPENHKDLASKMEMLLQDPALRQEIGAQARRDALLCFDEERYAEQYHRMLRKTLGMAEGDIQAGDVLGSG